MEVRDTSLSPQFAFGRSAGALAAAVGLGALALLAPPAALLGLVLLGARAALGGGSDAQIKVMDLIGPLFAALIVGACFGLDAGIGVLFVWRVLADTRWSVSEARRRAVAAGKPNETLASELAHLWITPVFGLTLVAFTAPHMVLGLPLDLPHLPAIVPASVGAVALLAVFDWALKRAADWRLGELAAAPARHALTHHALFLLAYGLTLDLSAGLVAMCAWRLAHAAPDLFPALLRHQR